MPLKATPIMYFSPPYGWLKQHGRCTNLWIGSNMGTI